MGSVISAVCNFANFEQISKLYLQKNPKHLDKKKIIIKKNPVESGQLYKLQMTKIISCGCYILVLIPVRNRLTGRKNYITNWKKKKSCWLFVGGFQARLTYFRDCSVGGPTDSWPGKWKKGKRSREMGLKIKQQQWSEEKPI